MVKSTRGPKVHFGRVLYVDDSPLARAAAARLIEARGFEPVVLASAGEVRELECAGFACALLDLEVGNESGTDIGRELRERVPNLPIAFLTAARAEPMLVEARKVGPVFCKATETDLALDWVASLLDSQLQVAAQ